MANPYNGYSWSERMAKFEEMKRRIVRGELAAPSGPCRLCGDPGESDASVKFEYHDEDYSHEYDWLEPAAYVLCNNCHIHRVHKRFVRPEAWKVFLAHVRRGGYAREMKKSEVAKELAKYRIALREDSNPPELKEIRPYSLVVGKEWFAQLTLDPASLDQIQSRPRP